LQSEPLAISQSKDRTAVREGEVFAGVQSVLFVGDELPGHQWKRAFTDEAR
jgi:hypothetical protein